MPRFGTQPAGTLAVELTYHSQFTYYLTLTIRELKLSEPIDAAGKRYQLPPGRYTVALKGLMGDPRYEGAQYAAFRKSYGSFEREQQVEIRSGEEAVCRFEFLGEVHDVTVRVVAAGEPVVGAEVLVEGGEANFRVMREPDGLLFHLTKGRYPVVVTYRDIMMKETIPVGEGESSFAIDISSQMIRRPQHVVVRYLDGRTLKGITADFEVGSLPFSLEQSDGGVVRLEDFAGVKAIFFVKSLEGNPGYKAHKDFSVARQFGRRTAVLFRDGELQHGYTLPEHADYPTFFLFPVDPKSNNDKVYIIREATQEIRLF
jgi:hypothetical protein